MTYAEKLKEAQDEISEYIAGKANELAMRCLNNKGMLHISTCNLIGYGWDPKLHQYMDDIAYEMKQMGISCYHSVKFEVDDWDFKVEVVR